jgi:SNF family Na+-dependent transporter
MASRSQGDGCAGCLAIVFFIALVVAAVTSVAALIDPFSWVPPIGKVFRDCTDNPKTPAVDECAPYRGLWWHVAINFVYALVALALLVPFPRVVREYRQARTNRFDSENAVERYRHAQGALVLLSVLLAGVAAIPIVAALA